MNDCHMFVVTRSWRWSHRILCSEMYSREHIVRGINSLWSWLEYNSYCHVEEYMKKASLCIMPIAIAILSNRHFVSTFYEFNWIYICYPVRATQITLSYGKVVPKRNHSVEVESCKNLERHLSVSRTTLDLIVRIKVDSEEIIENENHWEVQ